MRSSCARIKIFSLAALMLLFLASPGLLAKEVRVAGFGTRKCSEWQEWKSAQNGEARAMAIEWVNGFIAGHNVYARSGSEPASSVVADAKTLATLLDSYCQKNPENRILAGAIDIAQSLGGAKINIVPKAPAAGGGKPDGTKSPSDI